MPVVLRPRSKGVLCDAAIPRHSISEVQGGANEQPLDVLVIVCHTSGDNSWVAIIGGDPSLTAFISHCTVCMVFLYIETFVGEYLGYPRNQ